MSAKKFYYVCLGFVTALIIVLGASVYFMNNLLVKSSAKLVDAKLESRVAEERERYYIQAKKDVEKYKDVGDTLAKVLPKDKDQARAVAEIYRIADETGTSIKQISFPSSSLGDKKAVSAAGTTSAAPVAATVTQTKPVDGVTGVLAIDTQIQFQNPMTYNQLINFLEKVEKNRRNMQISAITVTPVKNNQLEISVSTRIFVKP